VAPARGPGAGNNLCKSQRFLLTERPISYIMLTKKSPRSRPPLGYPARTPRRPRALGSYPLRLLFLICGFRRPLLCEFVLDVLFEDSLVGPHHSPAIDKNRGRASDFQLLTVLAAGIDGGSGFRAGHARPKIVLVQPGLARIFAHLHPGVPGGDNFLIVVNGVV